MEQLTDAQTTPIQEGIATAQAAADSRDPVKIAKALDDLSKLSPIQAGPPSIWARNAVWLIFIAGMLVVLAALALGLIFKSNPASTISTLATAIVTGLFALFAPSPVSGTGGGSA